MLLTLDVVSKPYKRNYIINTKKMALEVRTPSSLAALFQQNIPLAYQEEVGNLKQLRKCSNARNCNSKNFLPDVDIGIGSFGELVEEGEGNMGIFS